MLDASSFWCDITIWNVTLQTITMNRSGNWLGKRITETRIDWLCTYFNTKRPHILMGQCKKDVTPLLMHWSYIFLALTHWYDNRPPPSCSPRWSASRQQLLTDWLQQNGHQLSKLFFSCFRQTKNSTMTKYSDNNLKKKVTFTFC